MSRTTGTFMLLAIVAGGLVTGFVLLDSSLARAQQQSENEKQSNAATSAGINHAQVIRSWDQKAFKEGRKVYKKACVTCHGENGQQPNDPRARAFGQDEFRNGADPYSMFQTLTSGYKQMPAMTWLSPKQRYNVIHYLREAFIKKDNPDQYVDVDKQYLSALPEGDDQVQAPTRPGDQQEFGGALSFRVKGGYRSALTVDLGQKTTISYDLHRMRSAGAWRGGFLDISNTLLTEMKAGGTPTPEGQKLPGLGQWQWALNGQFDRSPKNTRAWPPRGPAPKEWMQYNGRYKHGDRTVLSYRISDRNVLELPAARSLGNDIMLEHTLEVKPGNEPLKLAVGEAPVDGAAGPVRGLVNFDGEQLDKQRGKADKRIVAVSNGKKNKPFQRFTASAVAGDVNGLRWRIDKKDRLVLHIPAGDRTRLVRVMRYSGQGQGDMLQFASFARFTDRERNITRPSKLTRGGPEQWKQPVTVEGKLGDPINGYVLDTVPVPFDNPYNTWMRTSSLAFFPDGRAVVTTSTGDVWIVSGLDEKLEEVTWRRYAAGLYEPMGAQVVDGKVYVTCRDGITRLHDLNDDGEADYYEQFFSDPDVRKNWHMFNFDLQVDSQGYFYYAKAGIFNKTRQPSGSVLRISPDGSKSETMGTGFRTPNGMGILPDGRVTVSDNEGGWVPGSQINIAKKGAFYGYPRGPGPPGEHPDSRVPDDFKDPMIWTPQTIDSSSGGQVWVEDGFGPLSNRMLHTSFKPGKMHYVLKQESSTDIIAAMIVGLPYQFDSGVQRARQNPVSGEVWAVGISGWNNPPDPKDGCFQRLRYAGGARVIQDFNVRHNGIELCFNFPLDAGGAGKPENYKLAQWNYHWTHNYGSARFSVKNPDEEGVDPVPLSDVRVADDGRRILLLTDNLRPADQLRIKMNLPDASGELFKETAYFTIHQVPDNQ